MIIANKSDVTFGGYEDDIYTEMFITIHSFMDHFKLDTDTFVMLLRECEKQIFDDGKNVEHITIELDELIRQAKENKKGGD